MLFIGGPADGDHRAWGPAPYMKVAVAKPLPRPDYYDFGPVSSEARFKTVTYEPFHLHYDAPDGSKLRLVVAVPEGQTFLETFDLLLKNYRPDGRR